MHLTNSHPSWFALQVRPNREKAVAMMLRQKGYEEFLPVYKECRRWSDRIKEMLLPLFPCYLFCHFDRSAGVPVITTPGVIRIVGNGRTPIAINDEEIQNLQALVESGLYAEPWPFLRAGTSVVLEAGPLCGLYGTVIKVKNSYRLILSVSLLQRSVAVELDSSWVRPLADKKISALTS